ncbi:heat shock 70 kDa protein 1-like [Pseudoliparis swirei]|uniref:heat shock 70 kDa protein 1-like n=1 Tax=Pseudoliparis swirei TaxID=2059687 RepID=UPI0024BDBAD8|nr:heat shock 70 kDa protein 1-like [Pseudoliparis swirei]
MVWDADEYKAEDDLQRDTISAKNSLESYAFNLKSSAQDENLKGQLGAEDQKTLLETCEETIAWLENNQLADKDEYRHKQEELEDVCNPIVSKLYHGREARRRLWGAGSSRLPGAHHRGGGLKGTLHED